MQSKKSVEIIALLRIVCNRRTRNRDDRSQAVVGLVAVRNHDVERVRRTAKRRTTGCAQASRSRVRRSPLALPVASGQANYVVVHKVMTMEGDNRYGQAFARIGQQLPGGARSDGVLGAVRLAVAGADVRVGHAATHAEYGTTDDHYAEVTINARLMAANNPEARFRIPITVEDHHREPDDRRPAPVVRLLHGDRLRLRGDRHHRRSAPPTSVRRPPPSQRRGAGRARPLRAALMGTTTCPTKTSPPRATSVAEELTGSAGAGGRFRRADGLRPLHRDGADVARRLQALPEGRRRTVRRRRQPPPRGPLPTNTHGGNLAEAYTHGMSHVYEAVEQVRGTASNQIDGAENVLVIAGASPSPRSGMIISKERT